MFDWNSYLQAVIAWVRQLWEWLVLQGAAIRSLDLLTIHDALYARVTNATPQEQTIAGGVGATIVVVAVVMGWWAGRVYRDPALAQAALLAEVSLLMTQLRGRARRPATKTYRTLKRRIARSRRVFDDTTAERLWAQWKQADREVTTLLTTLRRSKRHVVRVEQYQHLSTLRDTLHTLVHSADR